MWLNRDEHFAECSGDSSTSEFDSDNWVKSSDSSFKGYECWVLVREDSKVAVLHSEADTCRDDVLCWHEPIDLLSRLI